VLHSTNDALTCTAVECGRIFPIVNGIPVLINEDNSIFSITDFLDPKMPVAQRRSILARISDRLLPTPGFNMKAAATFERLVALSLRRTERPRILVVGGATIGAGMQVILSVPRLEVIETDVSPGPRTQIICDGHDLPFAPNSFDAVIIQAVLEHVVDPYRCVDEIHRVLKDGCPVYADTPFMQQVHMGRYDFTRFTHLGHRRLFRRFEEIESGASCGPGMALAWSFEYFLLSFAQSRRVRGLLRRLARLGLFWAAYFDYLLIDTPGARDAAAGYYFLGTKSDHILSDRELIALYRGAQ
jgi:SAM-dependent methyltransferase